MQPTLLNSCARATTAAEAKFRIDGAPRTPRATCVVALDTAAAEIVRPYASLPWQSVRFLDYRADADSAMATDLPLSTSGGEDVQLSEELREADFVMMVATDGTGASAATTIGDAATLRGIMTAGVILGGNVGASAAVTALRPNARVLLVSHDNDDIVEILSEIGA